MTWTKSSFENSYIKVKNIGNIVENNGYTAQFSNRFESRLCQSESPRLNSLPIKLRSEYNAANFYNRPSLLPNKSLSCNCCAQWLNMSIIRLFPSYLLKNMSFANVTGGLSHKLVSFHYKNAFIQRHLWKSIHLSSLFHGYIKKWIKISYLELLF